MFLLVSPLSRLGATTFTVSNTNDSGAGSFRQAISDANTNTGSHAINFLITNGPPLIIKPASPLPSISNVVVIDATTQTGYSGTPKVELVGTNAGNYPDGNPANGIYLLSSNCTVRGFAINRFPSDGIRIGGAGGNTIQANFIGTDVNGTNALGNSQGGITIFSSSNLIGGVDATNRNLISGNALGGIYVLNSSATGNTIQGNYIGTDSTGVKRLPNTNNGILISAATGNLIGGTTNGARNLISGNSQSGIYFLDNANGNSVQGNFIGVNLAGTAALSNAADGISFSATSSGPKNNTIGGTHITARNLISGNGQRGVYISGGTTTGNLVAGNYIGVSSNGLVAISNGFSGVDILNASSNFIGSGAGNVISGNGLSGVKLGNLIGSGNVIQNNFIGTDASGTNTLRNSQYGIIISGVSGNTIGTNNVISGNTLSGVLITSNGTANVVMGNFIGTDKTGTRALGNAQSGVRIETPGNTIGGLATAARNIISGNTNNGIHLTGLAASNNLVQGNFIGTDVNGTNAVGNAIAGVGIDEASANTIGGSGARNVISGNANNGIYVRSNTAVANLIKGNYIGANLSGTAAIANGLALPIINIAGGIDISAAPATIIGGSNPDEGNLISGNLRDAICISEPGASNSVILGNLIGVQADGISPLGNEWNSVEVTINSSGIGGGSGTVIGGSAPGEGNVMAYATLSERNGVRIRTPTAGSPNTNILVRGNSIFRNGGSGNTGLAIALGPKFSPLSPNANDGCDGDDGANHLQNFPVLTVAYADTTHTLVTGALNSTANKTFLLQFYKNSTAIPGVVQGQTFLGDASVTTAGSCSTNFSITLNTPSAVGDLITASATDSNNNTSEFSAAVAVATRPTLVFTNSAANTNQFTLAWPTNAPGFSLQATTNLSPVIVWSPVTNNAVVAGTNFSVTLTRTNRNRFFRLIFP